MTSREIYRNTPDLSWTEWPRVVLPLYELLSSPMTTEDVVEWSLGPAFDVGGHAMSVARRTLYAKNMLAWLSLQGRVDHTCGKWRRVTARRIE